MGDAAGQLADSLHLLRLEKSLARGFQLALRLLTLGDVARDLGKADRPPFVVADGVYHHTGTKALAIFSHPPAFCEKTPFLSHGFESPGRLAPGTILFGIETREMLADDLVRF